MENFVERTLNEDQALADIKQRLATLAVFLNTGVLPDLNTPLSEWYEYLLAMKEIVGNSSNGMSFVACMMAKQYLHQKFSLRLLDVAVKAQGAAGLDIDTRTLDGKRIIGEVKTTTPYKGNDLGAAQQATFAKDFVKLVTEQADYKFFFVTDPVAFRLATGKYAAAVKGVTIVLLPSGEEREISL